MKAKHSFIYKKTPFLDSTAVDRNSKRIVIIQWSKAWINEKIPLHLGSVAKTAATSIFSASFLPVTFSFILSISASLTKSIRLLYTV